jgi:hypothetical protein
MLQVPVGGRRKSPSAYYRGCRHTKEEMQEKKSLRTTRTKTGRVFFSSLSTPGMSFASALRDRTEEQQQPQTHQVAVAEEGK